MNRALRGLLGVALLSAGVYFIDQGRPTAGPYRYPASARTEARSFARTIKDREARERFLEDTTGRVAIQHPRELVLGCTLGLLGLGCTLSSLRRSRPQRPAAPLRRVA